MPENMVTNASLTARLARFAAVWAAAALFVPSLAGDFLLFPKSSKTLSAETMPYAQELHAGSADGVFCLRGRFGVDFNIAGYRFADAADTARNSGGDIQDDRRIRRGGSVFFGISAATDVTMRPAEGMRFPVDNFYALLALRFSGDVTPKLSWRLYPIHHVSAHLADGYPGDILKQDVRPVSAEMARGELYYKPRCGIAEFGAALGYYYHVCAQKGLSYRGELSVLLQPPKPYGVRVIGGALSPYALIRVENVRQGADNVGAEAEAGAVAHRDGRGLGISAVYFNRLHKGYYFDRYEKGGGLSLIFIL